MGDKKIKEMKIITHGPTDDQQIPTYKLSKKE